MKAKEIWRKVLIFPEYEISNFGNVRIQGGKRLKKFQIRNSTDLYVMLGKKYGYPTVSVNKLVESEFDNSQINKLYGEK